MNSALLQRLVLEYAPEPVKQALSESRRLRIAEREARELRESIERDLSDELTARANERRALQRENGKLWSPEEVEAKFVTRMATHPATV